MTWIKGEYAPVFYKKGRFTCLKPCNFWLSLVTDRPNKGWDAALLRICTWVRLQETVTDRIFSFFNLHLDHIGVTARKESVKLVLNKINEICGDEPVILTGDFNVDQHNESYILLKNSNQLADTYDLAKIRYAQSGTLNGYNINRHNDNRIDHIFVSSGFEVIRYGIFINRHLPRHYIFPSTVAFRSFTCESGTQLKIEFLEKKCLFYA